MLRHRLDTSKRRKLINRSTIQLSSPPHLTWFHVRKINVRCAGWFDVVAYAPEGCACLQLPLLGNTQTATVFVVLGGLCTYAQCHYVCYYTGYLCHPGELSD